MFQKAQRPHFDLLGPKLARSFCFEPLARGPPPHNQNSSTRFYEDVFHPKVQKIILLFERTASKSRAINHQQLLSRMPPKAMASSKSRPSQTSSASTAWKPSTILEIGEITNDFHCIGHTKQHKPCENPIKKDSRTRAKEILLTMSTTSPASNTFDDELEELSDILLCWRHRKDVQQAGERTGK